MLELLQSTTPQGVVVLGLRGRLDALTAPELRPTIDALVAQRAQRVVCDLRELTMVDSSGVGAIVSLFKRLRTLGGDVKLAGLQGQPQEIFHLLRLDRVFEVFATAEAAAKTFG
jgi:anti-sigma B factor antagonist